METPISDDLTLHQTEERRTAALQRALATAVFGTAVAGIVIACLTLRLNPQIHARPADALLLIAYLCVGYAVILGSLRRSSSRRPVIPGWQEWVGR